MPASSDIRFTPPADLDLPPQGWGPADPFRNLAVADSFLSGRKHPQLLAIRYFTRVSDGILGAKVWFGADAEGPPGHAHGGTMAAVMDEGMGAAAWFREYPVLAAKISVDFKNKLPLGTVALLETAIEKVEGRKVFTSAVLKSFDGMTFCRGQGLFIVVDLARAGQ